MIPQRFAQSNLVMQAPKDMPDCSDIHAWRGKTSDGASVVITAFRPTPEELVKINLGEPIWLYIYGCGTPPREPGMPPVSLTADDPWQLPDKKDE